MSGNDDVGTRVNRVKPIQDKLRVLMAWAIEEVVALGEFTAQSSCNLHAKTGVIYPWGKNKGEEPEDYILHELLHFAIKEVNVAKEHSYRKGREAEEMLVQDLCALIRSNT